MKKVKQILAILGIILMIGVNVFNGAIVMLILVPVLLWIYLYIYKLIKQKSDNKELEKDLDEE